MRNRAGVVLYCKSKRKILSLKRIKNNRIYWVIPGGGVKENEHFEQAAIRELYEEIGYKINELEKEITIDLGDETEKYYISYVEDTFNFIIQGEEAKRENPNNRYIPEWISIDNLADFELLPIQLKKYLMNELAEDKKTIYHPIEPVYDENSKVLILGSFPSVKSREQKFFYGHPQNRFWKVISKVFGCKTPKSIEEKKKFLIKHGIALWDVIASCEIAGSSDSSIKNVVANDISRILNGANIERIYVNGKTAEKYYNKYIKSKIGREAVCLPSTSPANAVWSVEKLIEVWKVVSE